MNQHDPIPSHAPETDAGTTGGSLIAELAGAEGANADVPFGPPRRRVSSQTVVIAVVLVVSIGSLYGMRRIGMGAGMSFEETPVIPAQYEPEDPAKEREVLARLNRIGSPPQVPPERVDKNPFVFLLQQFLGDQVVQDEEPGDRAAKLAKERREARRRELNTRAESLELSSTMDAGSSRRAIIGGMVYGIGDLVEGTFILTEIGDRWVEVSAEGHSFRVEQSMTSSRSHPRRRRIR